MFGSQILDVAIGMIFVFLLLSLMCSALNEIIEAKLKNRAKNLELGIRNLLGNDKLANDFFDHALIGGLFKDDKKPSYIPSRTFALALMNLVAPTAWDTDKKNPLTAFRETVSQLRDDSPAAPIKKALLALADDAQGDITKLRTNIENWYDDTMDRVSGWYKRRTHTIIIFLGLGIAVALNADSAYIARNLSNDTALRNSLVSAAQTFAQKENPKPSPSPASAPANQAGARSAGSRTSQENGNANTSRETTGAAKSTAANSNNRGAVAANSSPTPPPSGANPATAGTANEGSNQTAASDTFQSNLAEIKKLGLPMGWSLETYDDHLRWPGLRIWQPNVATAWVSQIRFHWVGWILTALAISLGAPFWFDMLNKFIVVRSTVKPKEKSPEEPSKD